VKRRRFSIVWTLILAYLLILVIGAGIVIVQALPDLPQQEECK
jgi:hypothetical protein